jgi:hypothetical protein
MKIVFATMFCFVLGLADTHAAQPQVNQNAIDEVVAGRCKVARAAWWGFEAEESTRALQAAINSGAEKVIVEKMEGPWIVDKITLAANQELFFEPGVVVEAKKGAFHGKSDSLFSAANKSGIVLRGYGATLQMHRADYDSKEYTKAEWRHVLDFHSCSNVMICGLTLAESGGDGIYLGTGKGGDTNKNFVIKDVVCDRNYRQGISVITAENLQIENCVLKNTAGTPPAAGIDFEPNHPRERLVNCVMRNCVMENNQGLGLHVYARQFDGTTAPVSIRVEKCVTRGNSRSASIITSCGPKGPLTGTIDVVDCRFEENGKASITVGSNSTQGVKVRLVRCTLVDESDSPQSKSPILFTTRKGDLGEIGNVEFVDFLIRERVERTPMKFLDPAGLLIGGVSGKLSVERNGKRTDYSVDQSLVNQWMPVDPALAIPVASMEKVRLKPVQAAGPAVKLLFPVHRLRDQAVGLVWAEAGQDVTFRVRYQHLGRSEAKPMPVEVFSPAGKREAKMTVEVGKEGDQTFRAAESGVYRIVCLPQKHVVRIVSCSHPICLTSDTGFLHFVGTTTDLFFLVPAGTPRFAVRFCGEGDGERVKASVFDPAGEKVWEKDSIASSESYCYAGAAVAKDEIWKIHVEKPSSGAFEDNSVELRGIPLLMSFQPGGLLRPGL